MRIKLISLSDYVLKKDEQIRKNILNTYNFTIEVTDYNLFLLQKLKIEMFLPIDLKTNNKLEEPLKMDYGLDLEELNTNKYPIEQYQKDLENFINKEKNTIFQNFKIEDDNFNQISHLTYNYSSAIAIAWKDFKSNKWNFNFGTIEDLYNEINNKNGSIYINGIKFFNE